MDELDLIRRFGEGVPGPGEAVVQRARAALLERVEGSPRRPPRPTRRWAWAGAVAAMVVAAVLAAGLLVLGPEGGARAQAAEALNRAAEVAARQPAQAGEQGYRYTRSQDAYLSIIDTGGRTTAALVPHLREAWIGPDGSGRLRETSGPPIFFTVEDRERWEAAGLPSERRRSDRTFRPSGLHYEDLASLPTDRDGLYEVVRARAKLADPPVDVEMFIVVGDLLRETAAPPELRAALYRVAARIPGVELLGPVTDPVGRPGTAVAVTSDHSGALTRYDLIFDPETSALLAEREVLLERVNYIDAEPPVVIGWAAYLEFGTVPSTEDRP